MTAAGVFYPHGADTAEERLGYYASRFPLVEVDATYYSLPARRTAELWVERTPPDFMFDIKAHALMTGQPTETKRLPKDLREALPAELAEKSRIYAKDLPDDLKDDVWAWFADGLEPLAEAGQLGSILLQYPRWFFTSSENRDTIEDAVGRLRDVGMTPARSSSATRRGSTRRTSSGRSSSSATGRSRWSWSTARRASSRACRRSSRRPRRTSRSSASTAGGPRRGRRRASRPSSASATCTTRASSATGSPRVRETAAPGQGHPRPVQQLLRELRRDQRARAGRAAPGPRLARGGRIA